MQLIKGQSVKEHIKVMIEMFNELAVIGDNISDEDRVIYLLASLPESYEVSSIQDDWVARLHGVVILLPWLPLVQAVCN